MTFWDCQLVWELSAIISNAQQSNRVRHSKEHNAQVDATSTFEGIRITIDCKPKFWELCIMYTHTMTGDYTVPLSLSVISWMGVTISSIISLAFSLASGSPEISTVVSNSPPWERCTWREISYLVAQTGGEVVESHHTGQFYNWYTLLMCTPPLSWGKFAIYVCVL